MEQVPGCPAFPGTPDTSSKQEDSRSYGAAGDWSHNPEDWNSFRRELLQAIAAK